MKAKSDKATDDQQEARAAKSYKPGPQPRSASVRLKSRPRAPLPRRSRPTTWLPSTRILAKRPSAMNKPELGRTSKGRRGCQVKAQPRLGNAHQRRHQACAGGPCRGAGRHREAEAPIGALRITPRQTAGWVRPWGRAAADAKRCINAAGTLRWTSRPSRIQQRVAGRIAHCAVRLAKPHRAFLPGSHPSRRIRNIRTKGRSGDVNVEVGVCRRNGHVPTSHNTGRAVE